MECIPKHPILEFNPGTLEYVRKAFNLDQGRMEEAIDRLEEWMAKQQHFVKKDFSRDYLERSLIQCKGSVEKAKSEIDKLCTYKTLLPKYFKNFDENELKSMSDTAWVLTLPKMTQDYYRILIIKLNAVEATAKSYTQYHRLNIILYEHLKRLDYSMGYIVILDYRSIDLMDLLANLNLVELQQFATIIREGYGTRMPAFHVISSSKLIDVLAKTLKQVFSPKTANRLHVHSDIESLHNAIPLDKDILPLEYGGKERAAEKLNEQWIQLLSAEDHIQYMKEMNAACTDESLRHKDKFNEQYLGMPGTFRRLDAD